MPKSQQRIAFTGFRSSLNGQRGFTLMEVLIALAILAAAAVTFLVGITTSSKAVMVSQKNIAAESLAKSELEYVKSTTYCSANVTWSYELPSNPPAWAPTHSLPDGYVGYSVNVNGSTLPGHTFDDGIQRITVTVTRNGEPAFSLIGYKVEP